MNTTLYDKPKRRLISIDNEASPEFWDKHWKTKDFIGSVIGAKTAKGSQDKRLKSIAGKYLFANAKILDAGCGRGRFVYGFHCWGYDSYGVDTAKNTLSMIKENFPELKVYHQDVRDLKFEDNFFDCYFSGGVIEHFWEGYDTIIVEANRVLKPGGYLIVTIPYFSPLRRLKAVLGLFKSYKSNAKPENFYQFFLNHKKVMKKIEHIGFKPVEVIPYNEILGLKNEFPSLSAVLCKVQYDESFLYKTINKLFALILTKITAHSIMFIFRKNQ